MNQMNLLLFANSFQYFEVILIVGVNKTGDVY